MAVSPPIILDINSTTKEKTPINYGVKGQGFDEQTKILLSLSFNEYMNYFPDNENGLWGVIEEILNKKINIEKFQEKYKIENDNIDEEKMKEVDKALGVSVGLAK